MSFCFKFSSEIDNILIETQMSDTGSLGHFFIDTIKSLKKKYKYKSIKMYWYQ